jgi:6-pyruvoyltetrahydropterin/6-carboxytetrahydropterin synthase
MPVYLVRARARFEAAHHLLSYRGKPESSHGHSWSVEAVLRSGGLNEEGMAFDFVELQGALRRIVARFDHRDLNAIEPFAVVTPTTENVARQIFSELAAALPGAPLAEVTVWEGPDCAITVVGDSA